MGSPPTTPPRVMRGATAGTDGASGYVAKPAAGQEAYMLLGDGTWGAQPIAGLPSQTSNSGKLLTTDGTNAAWTTTGVLTSLTAPASTDLTLSGGSTSGKILFNSPSATERARLTSTGNLLIGTTTDTTRLTVKPGSNTYQLSLLQSNTDAAGWGMWADTSGNLNLTRYGSSTFGTPALVFSSAGNPTVGAGLTFSAPTIKVTESTASIGVGTGALQVTGGIYAGAASVFGSTVTASSNVKFGSGSAVALGAQFVVMDGGSEARLQINSTDRPGLYLTAAGANVATLRGNTTTTEILTSGGTPLSINNSTLAATFAGAVIGTPSALSGAGAVPITALTASLTSTGAAQAITLANGTAGQILNIVHVVDGGSMVLTPTTKIGFSTVTFTGVGESVALVYTAAGWAVTGSYLAVIAP